VLEQIDALKKPNTHRNSEAVLNRVGEFFRECSSIDSISVTIRPASLSRSKKIISWA
jgi:hypothetical protein